MSQPYDKFFLQVGIGGNRKVRRLPVSQRWTYVAGVLALAAQSPMRGSLLIADGHPVTAADVAAEAHVPIRVASAALVALRELGMLERDENGIEWVHDWDKINPDPKPSDSPQATRERKRLERERRRQANGHAGVTRDVTPIRPEGHAPKEEEKERTTPPSPPRGNRQRDLDDFRDAMGAYVREHFPDHPARLIQAHAATLRRHNIEPTAEAIQAMLDHKSEAVA